MAEKTLSLYQQQDYNTKESKKEGSPKRQLLKTLAASKKPPTILIMKQVEYNNKYTVSTPNESQRDSGAKSRNMLSIALTPNYKRNNELTMSNKGLIIPKMKDHQ